MKGKQYSTKEVIGIITDAGFKFKRNGKGSHMIYERDGSTIAIPVAQKSVNRMMFKRICKQNNICLA